MVTQKYFVSKEYGEIHPINIISENEKTISFEFLANLGIKTTSLKNQNNIVNNIEEGQILILDYWNTLIVEKEKELEDLKSETLRVKTKLKKDFITFIETLGFKYIPELMAWATDNHVIFEHINGWELHIDFDCERTVLNPGRDYLTKLVYC